MKKNEIFIGTCIDYTYNGLGVVKNGTFAVFVKDMIVGETGRIVVTATRKEYGYGRLLELINPSDERVETICPISKQCGGCQLQHMSYKAQCLFKQQHVQNTIKNIGKIDVEVNEIIPSSLPFGYRNKVILPVGEKDGKVVMGFYRYNSHDIIPMDTCYLQTDYSNYLVNKLKVLINKHQLAKSIRNIMIRDFNSTQQAMVVIVTKVETVEGLEKLVADLIEGETRIKSVIQNINPNETNVVLGKEEKLLFGDWYIQDVLNNLIFEVSSKSFYQVNSIQTSVLYSKAIELAEINENDTVIDLYCGVGTIGLIASGKAKKVIGVEIVEKAIEDAKKNASINSIENIEFICGDASIVVKKFNEEKQRPDVVLLDPPRKGCSSEVLENLVQLSSRKIVYISCNPATLARDLQYLTEQNYRVEIVQPVDMFSQSYHIETIAVLERE